MASTSRTPFGSAETDQESGNGDILAVYHVQGGMNEEFDRGYSEGTQNHHSIEREPQQQRANTSDCAAIQSAVRLS